MDIAAWLGLRKRGRKMGSKQSQSDSIKLPAWPHGCKAAVSLTYDVDADVYWRQMEGRLTTRSEAQFGARTGLRRILDMMKEHGASGTFFVPGEIARIYPTEIMSILEAGHEIGNHGHIHLTIDMIREIEQRDELLRGSEELEKLTGVRPRGYRCPGWELTPFTLELLLKEDFRYDSSCMGDDRPYYLQSGSRPLLEFPVHWSLDDWVFFRFGRDRGAMRSDTYFGGEMSNPEACFNTWKREIQNAIIEGRHVTLTMHPETIGRGYRSHFLSELVGWMKSEKVWVASLEQVANHIDAQ
jgi:peptidoglycan/xylan/chitin deacetylase (PgdA/CDA1 family)